MKITINKSNIENIISNFQSFLEKRDKSQITSHILIQTKDDNIILKATDYEIGIKAKIQNESIENDEIITVDGKKFLDSLKNLKDDKITLQSKDDKLEIKQGKSTIKLPSFVADNFPEFPQNYEKSKINIDSKNLIESLKKLLPVIEINNPRAEYRNALIDIKEYKFNFVATDTKRLEVISFNNQSVDKINFMFPKKAISEIQKFFNEDSNIYFNENTIIIENEKYTFWTRIPNGNFIDYERVIPKEIKYKIQINKEQMIESLKIINSISNQVKIIFSKNKINFESISEEDSNANTEIELNEELNKEFINSINEDIMICVNSKHILDFIVNIDTQNFEFGINEKKNSACILKSDNFILTMMPILI
ncbi:DNA polymerase III subunit beta [Helicobacter sp. MIT 14-3879]|uniref:DNA polymerase III subunit beta n=1 Tax=Helicobacter sp. MIT 14-3879 TaxID=2040649 RepID=UPI000E1F85C7|nr:DNA polymerase III subunit beta [Helicobacter sp. MIT 14-3879]RDU65026.1 DNA polymerase III subunit beta [Helicobacter sp. MIT 14-3879]